MKADFQKLALTTNNSSFIDFWVKSNSFGVHWHYHPEIEICYVKQGEGHRIVGDSIEKFGSDDLVLLGSHLPHCWTTSELFNHQTLDMEVYVIQFNKDHILNNGMEFKEINQLLESAQKGIKFDILKDNCLKPQIKKVDNTQGLEKYLSLLTLLHLMCKTIEKSTLVSNLYTPEYSKKAEKRIVKACNYIHQNYREHIVISEIAELVSMNPSSFCRYFKKYIGKTIIEYVNDLRINYACNQLQNTPKVVHKIAYDCGYQSVTQFNKIFKRLMNETPTEYRKLNHYRPQSIVV